MILLGGAPGSGKTTTARFLSEKTGIPFIDIDDISMQYQPFLEGQPLWDKFFKAYEGTIKNGEQGIFIGTFNMRNTRDMWRNLALQNGYEFKAVFFDLPREIVFERCLLRPVGSHKVNENNAKEILEKWYQNLGDINSSQNQDIGIIWLKIQDPKLSVDEIVRLLELDSSD